MGAELLDTMVTVTTSIYEAEDRAALVNALKSGCSALGFDNFTLTCHSPPGRELILDHTLSSLGGNFMSDYDHYDWFECDPNAPRVLAGERPFFWDTRLDQYADVRNRSYLDYLHSAEMRTGVLVPLPHRPGTASVMGMTTLANRDFPLETLFAAAILANAGMARAEMLGLCPGISSDEAAGVRLLSRPQLEILKWITEGKSNFDIATIMGLNERAVRYHVTEILRKLSVATRAQAAVIFRSSRGAGANPGIG